MRPVAQIRPTDFHALFQFADDLELQDVVRVRSSPFVLQVPQDADSPRRDYLYIVIEGNMRFEVRQLNADGPLKTIDFGTHAAYFRHKGGSLEHVYGAHYDFSDDVIGHPTFHAQMKSFHQLWPKVNETFSLQCAAGGDEVSRVLKNVRLPSAQMDMFSLILQICADHLVSKKSSPEEREAFAALSRTNAEYIRGAGYRIPRLCDGKAQICYRAHHWYSNPP